MGRDADFKFETDPEDSGTRDAILHRASGPVLIVPEDAADRPPRNAVVIAYDGSGAAKRALASFVDSGLAQGRDVHVATVDDSGARAYEMADSGVKALAALGVAATPNNIVSAMSNVDALLTFAEEVEAGLMVMGAFARSRIATFFKAPPPTGSSNKPKSPSTCSTEA